MQDANDHAPVFDESTYNATVREDFPVNATLLTVHAADADDGQNADVVYSLDGSTAAQYAHLLALDPATGTLTLRQRLDHEMQAQYTLTVTARDRGPSPSAAAYATVTQAYKCSASGCCRRKK